MTCTDRRVRILASDGDSRDSRICEIEDGKFYFEGEVASPTEYTLYLEKPNQRSSTAEECVELYVEPGANMKIVLNTKNVKASLVEGSKTDKEYRKLVYDRDTVRFGPELDRIKREWVLASEVKDSVKLKALMEEYKLMNEEVKQWNIDYILQNPKSYVSAYQLYKMEGILQPHEISAILARLDPSLSASGIILKMKSHLKNQIGQAVTDFRLPDVTGEQVVLSDIIRNKVAFIDFWWSGCKPCREENPQLQLIYQEYKAKGFEIVSVSSDRDKHAWLNAIKKDGITWTNLSDPTNEVSESFYVRIWPSTFLVDKNGIVIAKNLTAEELRMKLETLLK